MRESTHSKCEDMDDEEATSLNWTMKLLGIRPPPAADVLRSIFSSEKAESTRRNRNTDVKSFMAIVSRALERKMDGGKVFIHRGGRIPQNDSLRCITQGT